VHYADKHDVPVNDDRTMTTFLGINFINHNYFLSINIFLVGKTKAEMACWLANCRSNSTFNTMLVFLLEDK